MLFEIILAQEDPAHIRINKLWLWKCDIELNNKIFCLNIIIYWNESTCSSKAIPCWSSASWFWAIQFEISQVIGTTKVHKWLEMLQIAMASWNDSYEM